MKLKISKKAIEHLSKADSKLSKQIKSVGVISREIKGGCFSTLLQSIVGQQISGRAQESICNKLEALIGEFLPENFLSADFESVRACGLSLKKATWIKSIAEKFASGELSDEKLKSLPDDEVLKILTGLDGIGIWTAEMFLIFCLGRKDVLSYGDFGIRKGLCILHGLENMDKKKFKEFKDLYTPTELTPHFIFGTWQTAKNYKILA